MTRTGLGEVGLDGCQMRNAFLIGVGGLLIAQSSRSRLERVCWCNGSKDGVEVRVVRTVGT